MMINDKKPSVGNYMNSAVSALSLLQPVLTDYDQDVPRPDAGFGSQVDVGRIARDEFDTPGTGADIFSTVGNTAKGAQAGAQIGGLPGAIAGGVIGLGSSLFGFAKRKRARQRFEDEKLNSLRDAMTINSNYDRNMRAKTSRAIALQERMSNFY